MKLSTCILIWTIARYEISAWPPVSALFPSTMLPLSHRILTVPINDSQVEQSGTAYSQKMCSTSVGTIFTLVQLAHSACLERGHQDLSIAQTDDMAKRYALWYLCRVHAQAERLTKPTGNFDGSKYSFGKIGRGLWKHKVFSHRQSEVTRLKVTTEPLHGSRP